MTGFEHLEYQVRLVRSGLNILVSSGRDKKLQQALAKDIFTFFKVSIESLVLVDYTELTETREIDTDRSIMGTVATDAFIGDDLKQAVTNEFNRNGKGLE